MKIRCGFVSNSSSSSFAISMYGIEVNSNKDKEALLKKFDVDFHDYLSSFEFVLKDNVKVVGYAHEDALEYNDDEDYDECDDGKNDGKEERTLNMDSVYIWIGREYSTIKLDETGKQFQDSTKNIINKEFKKSSCKKINYSTEIYG